ncbi:uncharacterized protein [Clytia hemisphaerica]|uniref:uncharacterized protein n=1 Tax=Clytia hemisphaerica TaxID=252671 RepID=UPI0034D62D36
MDFMEFLPEHYTASRQDRADGKGGVIIIYKVSLLVEEIKQKSDILQTAQDAHVPNKNDISRYTQPWFNRDWNVLPERKKTLPSIQTYKTCKDYDKYILAEKEARKTCDNAYNNYIRDKVLSDKRTLKDSSPFIKAKKTNIVGVSPLLDNNGQIQTEDLSIAETLNKQFSSVFSADDGISPEINDPQGPPIGKITFTKNGITKLLKDLDPNKASGPDGISTRILKECADEISDFLSYCYSIITTKEKYQ